MKKLILLLAFVGITANTDCFAGVFKCNDGQRLTIVGIPDRGEGQKKCASHGGLRYTML